MRREEGFFMTNSKIFLRFFAWLVFCIVFLFVALLLTTWAVLDVAAKEDAPKIYSGPYEADVVRVIDADTIKMRVYTWPDHSTLINVRLAGVDTPETGRPQCRAERAKGHTATAYVKALMPIGQRINLINVMRDKFGGRVVGSLQFKTSTGVDLLSDALIRRGHGVRYFGGKKTKNWCAP